LIKWKHCKNVSKKSWANFKKLKPVRKSIEICPILPAFIYEFQLKDLSKHISQRQILESQLTENKFVKEVKFELIVFVIYFKRIDK
jgi:hypothetical protein